MTLFGALGLRARRLAVLALCLAMSATITGLSGCGYGQPVPIPPPRQVGSSGLVVSPQSISMSPTQVTTLTVSEKGYQGTFSESDDCSGIVSVVETGGSTFKVTANAVGLCTITITDQGGNSQDIAVSIQSVILGGQ
ncbi:MAG TPA: hypothetical protein VFO25_05530 [Candidatus Eremiobacteraceae bacterium]|nr:hypothetical protein [Candidatus Eremiobacteraceae bacterium]